MILIYNKNKWIFATTEERCEGSELIGTRGKDIIDRKQLDGYLGRLLGLLRKITGE